MSNFRNQWVSRTSLSRNAGALRLSLLVSLGYVPVACGGTAVTDASGGGEANTQGGESGYGGGLDMGGASAHAGATSYAGYTAQGGHTWTLDCQSPKSDPRTHLVTCANGLEHRPQAVACAPVPVDNPGFAGDSGSAGDTGEGGAGPGPGAGASSVGRACQSNADCRDIPLGYCERPADNEAPTCAAGCVQDSDCGANAICICDGVTPGQCVRAGCAVDADCGVNSFCSPVSQVCGVHAFECLSLQDECRLDSDCGMNGTCAFVDGHRACDNAVCGRPFLVENRARVAALASRADWLDASLKPDFSGLSPLQRAELAAHWARLGQLEHASIAAFARFNLQLLSLGAPAELVEACNAALADETAHTRLCFALASQYGGGPIGPARLNLQHCFEDSSLTAIMKLVLSEGCVGETVASLEALEAAEQATDPAVKSALSRIAEDEREHAKLAFDFLRWALAESPPEVRVEIEREAEQRLARFEREANARRGTADHALAAHGRLGAQALRAVHLTAVREVVRPLLAALFCQEHANARCLGTAPTPA
jgi:hypothetical protein